MKFFKFALVITFIFVMMGCGTGEWRQHDTMYKNWDHLQFSWAGYNTPTPEDIEKSSGESWWGIEIPVENAK